MCLRCLPNPCQSVIWRLTTTRYECLLAITNWNSSLVLPRLSPARRRRKVRSSLVPRPFFAIQGKISLVNGLFRSRSLRRNVGGPIRSLFESDVIDYTGIMYGARGIRMLSNRGSMQETRLRRTETRAREGCQELWKRSGCVESLSTVNGQFECQQDCSRVSLSLKEVFLSRIVVSWRSEPLGKTVFVTKCLRTALLCATVVPHFI